MIRGWVLLPTLGGSTSAPERLPSHAIQSVYQLPSCLFAGSRQVSGESAGPSFTR
jgi:hypothetical protein